MTAHIAILIPARLGSTRMPEKLMRAETGRPLVTHVLDVAEAARAASDGTVAEVIVVTDSPRIADAVTDHAATAGYGARAVLSRGEHASGTERIAEAAADLPDSIRLFVNIQGDEPELPPEAILRVARLLDERPEAGMSTLVRPMADEAEWRNPNMVKAVVAADGACLYFSRAPVPYDRDGARRPGDPCGHLHFGVYGYRREVLLGYPALPASHLEALEKLEQLRALEAGIRIVAAETDYAGAGVDTEEDYRAFVARTARVASG
ncbi:MAG: 3-deoxy-manno-octulosonate cytidylyltransferase [Planctomycetota bacterium]